MTVKELIERLEGMNPDSEIVLVNMIEFNYGEFGRIATTIDSVWSKDGYTFLDGGIE